jgi:hypothetical protein
MEVLHDQGVPAIVQTPDLSLKEFPRSAHFPRSLFCLRGYANRSQLLAIAVEITGEPTTEGSGIELIGLAAGIALVE